MLCVLLLPQNSAHGTSSLQAQDELSVRPLPTALLQLLCISVLLQEYTSTLSRSRNSSTKCPAEAEVQDCEPVAPLEV